MKKFYWFGDSWVVGSELDIEAGSNADRYTFAKLVSDHYQAECVNLGLPGTSNDLLPLVLKDNLKDIDPENDILFFCLTSSARVTMFDDNKQALTILPSIQDKARRHNEHPYWREWYKYFDNKNNQIYNYDHTINLMSFWCKHLEIKFYMLNLFTTVTDSIFDLTSPSDWLLPKDQCLANFIFPVTDIEFGGIVIEDRAWLTNDQWTQQQKAIAQYISPCQNHPNIAGHQKIANKLIKIIEQLPYK